MLLACAANGNRKCTFLPTFQASGLSLANMLASPEHALFVFFCLLAVGGVHGNCFGSTGRDPWYNQSCVVSLRNGVVVILALFSKLFRSIAT